jgi:hypothetical protein
VRFLTGVVLLVAAGCSQPTPAPAQETKKPVDAQHAGITTPHGDHSPHHGGLVLMNGEMHYEVVFDRGGKHRIWFSNAVREDLPASVASKVVMMVTRKDAPDETIALQIDDNGESWVGAGQPVIGNDVMVKISYEVRGEPYEIEVPFVK